ncbi:MAG: glycosyltransferase family 39 protein [Verrucomicrobiaceae bacterium]|nr:glycosyltransferase family 39 protein [Verrucomicrobiaceae bacterium]
MPSSSPHAPISRSKFFLCLGLVTVMFIGIRAPLLDRPWHQDEQHTLAFHLAGFERTPFPQSFATEARPRTKLPDHITEAIVKASERRSSRPVQVQSWSRTLFANEQGNNSPPATALARLCNGVSHWFHGTAEPVVHQLAVRLPSLLCAALAAAALFALCASRLGLVAALVASLLFALHPLVIDLSTLMRGYAFLLLMQTGSWWCYSIAIEQKDRRAWWAGAATTAGALWAFPGYGYVTILLQGWLTWHLWRSRENGMWKTWLVSHSIAAIAWALVAWPAFAELYALMKSRYPFESHHWLWIPRMLGEGLSGLQVPDYPYAPLAQPADTATALSQTWQTMPGALLIAWIVIPVMLVIGIWRLVRQGHIWLVVCIISTATGALLSTGHQAALRHEMLPWYGIYLAPASCLALSGCIPPHRRSQHAAALILLLMFGWLTFPDQRPGRLHLYPNRSIAQVGYYHDTAALVTLSDGRTLLAFPSVPPAIRPPMMRPGAGPKRFQPR